MPEEKEKKEPEEKKETETKETSGEGRGESTGGAKSPENGRKTVKKKSRLFPPLVLNSDGFNWPWST